ncbi:FecCD family ABC transporter permease [Streptomyces anulatus]|uniref:FecCD family ABC transporter permease n=1 Tax=Streptomyces anulatus TaxID=1892 RepID=UPI0038683DA1|nr:iron chelate uptake ABC transporter family permease subunit [Streptomyces anulatus]
MTTDTVPEKTAGAAGARAPLTKAAARPFRLAFPPVSGTLRPRQLAVCAGLAVAVFAALCWHVSIGEYGIPLADVARALTGSGDAGTLLVVQELRLPRAMTGLLAGIAFGMSGALFQTMTRNPLASPDMIGLTQGAGTAVVAGLVLGWDFGLGTQALGLLGALTSALLVYGLAWRRGTTGYRIILVGIGVSWVCLSATDFLLARGGRFQAQAALGWLVGNLNGRDWQQAAPLAYALVVLVPAALLIGRLMRTLQLGDDVAKGLGTRVQAVRLTVLLTGVGLVAFATAAAGPVAFVALAAPQIAQRLCRTAWPPPLAAGLTGALVVLASDVLARELIPGIELPVGIVTGVLGAPVLLWLLIRVNRAGSGG